MTHRPSPTQDAYDEYVKRCFASHGIRGAPWEHLDASCSQIFDAIVDDILGEVRDALNDELEATIDAELAIPAEFADRVVPADGLSAAGVPMASSARHSRAVDEAPSKRPYNSSTVHIQQHSDEEEEEGKDGINTADEDEDAESGSYASLFRPPTPSDGAASPALPSRTSPVRDALALPPAGRGTRSRDALATADAESSVQSAADYTEDFEATGDEGPEDTGASESEGGTASAAEPVAAYESDFESVENSSQADSVASSVATLSP